MKVTRIVVITIGIWLLGVTVFTLSHWYPFLEEVEFQSNLLLGVAILPLSWFGAHAYYLKDQVTSGLHLGIVMVSITIALDAIFTVPFFVIPEGGTYSSFFMAPGFWLLIIEYLAVVALYKKLKINR